MSYDFDHSRFELASPFDRLDAKAFRLTHHGADAPIFRQDDPTHGMFVVISGSVELRRHTSSGALITIHRAATDETFAEASLFADRYHCDAVTTSQSTILRIDRDSLLDRMKVEPEFAIEITARFARDVQKGRRQVELLSVKSAKERVFMAVADGMLGDSVIGLAHQIGLTQEATYRALSALVRSGMLCKVGRGRYELGKSPQISKRPIPARTS